MNEPYRLREQCESALESALLHAGASYRAPESTRLKTLAALGLAGTAAVSVSVAATAASTSFFGKLGWTQLLAVSGIGAAAAVPVGYYALSAEEPAPPAPVVVQAPEPARRVVPPAREPVSEPPAPLPAPEAPVAVAAPKAEPARSAAPVNLTAELGALDAARSRLASGDAQGALALLDEYSRKYPRGRLALEAEVLRIDALAKSGQRSAAAKRAEAFLRRHPNSVLASRVRGYLSPSE